MLRKISPKRTLFLILLGLMVAFVAALPVIADSLYPPMMAGKDDYAVTAVFTIGETVGDYQPVGIPDGTGAYDYDSNTVRVLVNHELSDSQGYAYALANGTQLVGARVSYFDIDKTTRDVVGAGPAYDTVYDRQGQIVTDALQINEGDTGTINGFDRFCSAQAIVAGEYSFVDNIFFTNEETSTVFGHPHGGTVWALDVAAGDLWAVPALGRGTWENVTALETRSSGHVALLLGDDFAGAPLYLYVGRKNAVGDGSFLDRNGLVEGNLFAWKSLNGDQSPEDFNGTGSMLKGTFVPVTVQDESMAGQPGYDAEGYLNDVTMRNEAIAKGAFRFSRPEDLHTNPHRGTEVVMASTGRGQLFPSDNWGMVYKINAYVRLESSKGLGYGSAALLTIMHDANEYGDFGIRSADNLVWSENGNIYIQEDRSTNPDSLFGSVSGREASIWQLHPRNYSFSQVAEMDRTAVAPTGSTDSAPTDIGNWESSGILDVTDLFPTAPGELLLLSTIEAHSVRDGIIAANGLVQGGQIILISQP